MNNEIEKILFQYVASRMGVFVQRYIVYELENNTINSTASHSDIVYAS